LLQQFDEDTAPLSGTARIRLLGEMAQQLTLWHEALPEPLKWPDGEDDPWVGPPSIDALFNSIPASSGESEYSYDDHRHGSGRERPPDNYKHPTQDERSGSHFNLGAHPTGDGFNLDIVTAALRTRFYYARFMIYLPFVYKTLHAPQDLSIEDTDNCLVAIHSACDWPLFMEPPRNKKRLVPNLFTWTQNFISMLLILHMAMKNPDLHAVCKGRIPAERITRAVTLMLDWIYDMRQIDTIAQWGWQILEPLFFSSRS
jgi:hypothetical protein